MKVIDLTRPPDDYRFFVSVDLGQQRDRTAIVVIDRPRQWHLSGTRKAHEFRVVWLGQAPLQTSYVKVVDVIAAVTRAIGEESALVVDRTGVGQPVVDALRERGLRPCGVSLHGGAASTVSRVKHGWDASASKADVIASLSVALDQGRFLVARDLPLAEVLREELASFRVKLAGSRGHAKLEAEGRLHDDFVLAAALGVWWGSRPPSARGGWIPLPAALRRF